MESIEYVRFTREAAVKRWPASLFSLIKAKHLETDFENIFLNYFFHYEDVKESDSHFSCRKCNGFLANACTCE